jgi:RHS repeat-associated protein
MIFIDLEYNLPNPFGGSSSSFTMRGYTFHEHLEMVGLINMNGRMYDPILGRMLSPDNYVQAPDNTQSFNRYSYCWNNPLKYTDPSGDIIFTAAAVVTGQWWALPMAIGADIGMWQGGSMANGTANPFKWDYSSGKTWGYMAGGAFTGAASAYIGGSIAMSGTPMASSMAIMFGSHINSMGTATYTGNQTDYTLSFGAASYNFDQDRWGFLGKEGNTGWENFGYALGAFTNISDIYGVAMGAYGDNAKSIDLQSDNHSSLYDKDGKSLLDVGVQKARSGVTPGEAISGGLDLSTDYRNHQMSIGEKTPRSLFYRRQTINNVRVDKIGQYKSALSCSGKGYGLFRVFGGANINCAGAASNALLKAGVFNIPLGVPGILSLQMYVRQYGYNSFLVN